MSRYPHKDERGAWALLTMTTGAYGVIAGEVRQKGLTILFWID